MKPGLTARLIDATLEATVAGSYSRLGPAVRRRIDGWTPPASAKGRTVVVTGATSGIGLAAATGLASLGADVVLVGRDAGRTERAREAVAESAVGRVSTELADLSSAEEARGLAARLSNRLERLDVLVHNAGALFPTRQVTAEGNEMTLAVHLLGPYVLTEGLRPLLGGAGGGGGGGVGLGGGGGSDGSRVVTVTSGGMYSQRFDLARLEMGDGGYKGTVAYARAKRAQVVLTHEWQRRYSAEGIDFHVMHPGWVDTPGLEAGMPRFARLVGPALRTPTQGADTVVWLAGSPSGVPAGGRLWLDRRPRGEYRVPGTWMSSAERAVRGQSLWAWCRDRTASMGPGAGAGSTGSTGSTGSSQ